MKSFKICSKITFAKKVHFLSEDPMLTQLSINKDSLENYRHRGLVDSFLLLVYVRVPHYYLIPYENIARNFAIMGSNDSIFNIDYENHREMIL